MKNSACSSARSYNQTEGRFVILLNAWLSLVMYNAICTKQDIKDWLVCGPGGSLKSTDSLIATGYFWLQSRKLELMKADGLLWFLKTVHNLPYSLRI